MKTVSEIVPLLVVRDAAKAIDFYVRALGAREVSRYEHGPERRVSHADVAVGALSFAVTEELPGWNSDAPPTLGGSPVVLQLSVADTDAVLASMREAGAAIVFPAQELLGERMARVRDPFGHIWILRQRLEALSGAEIQRQRDELWVQLSRVENHSKINESPAVRQGARARIHLIIGPVGAGKSTYALRLAREHAAVRLTLDEWMARLFRQDRPDEGVMEWYAERTARCIEQIWTVAKGVVEAGTGVVLEIGLIQRRDRERFYRRVDDAGFDMTLHVLDAPRDVRRERVHERNRTRGATFSMVVPPAIFELASDLWEPPGPDECDGRHVRFIRPDKTSSDER